MKKINYHTHTRLCKHADGMEQDYAKAALRERLDVLGFSDHAPFPDGRFDLRMEYEELDAHLNRIAALKEELKENLTILTGLEIEYCRDMKDYYKSLLDDPRLDYLILGQHFFPDGSGNIINAFRPGAAPDTGLVTAYADSLCEAMGTGYFSILAHPDVIFISDLPWDEKCDTACGRIIAAARDTGTIIELNANGIRRGIQNFSDGRRYPYPHPRFWKKVEGTSIPVMINSDCHTPDQLWDASMNEAYALARRQRLNLVYSI